MAMRERGSLDAKKIFLMGAPHELMESPEQELVSTMMRTPSRQAHRIEELLDPATKT